MSHSTTLQSNNAATTSTLSSAAVSSISNKGRRRSSNRPAPTTTTNTQQTATNGTQLERFGTGTDAQRTVLEVPGTDVITGVATATTTTTTPLQHKQDFTSLTGLATCPVGFKGKSVADAMMKLAHAHAGTHDMEFLLRMHQQ